MNPSAPVLSKEDYFTIPAIKRLRRCSDDELQVQILYYTTGVLQLLGMQGVVSIRRIQEMQRISKTQ
jgi:hypothetical protein